MISVITRTKDRKIFLPRVFKSLLAQSYRPIEWIVVNDAGEDLESVINDFKQEADEELVIKYIYKEISTGMEAASNFGIEQASGKYINILDDDDTIDKEFYAKTIHYLETIDVVSIEGVISYSQYVYEKVESDIIKHIRTQVFEAKPNSITLIDILKQNLFPIHSFVYKSACLAKVGLYNESYPVLGDWDFNIRFVQKYDIGIIPEILTSYHKRIDKVYGNTDKLALDKHLFYDGIIRNNIMRNNKDLSAGMGQGTVFRLIEGSIFKLQNSLESLDSGYIESEFSEKYNKRCIEEERPDLEKFTPEIEEMSQEDFYNKLSTLSNVVSSSQQENSEVDTEEKKIYRFQYLGDMESQFIVQPLNKKIKAQSDKAVIVHLYYYDLKDEVFNHLNTFNEDLDIYISLPESMDIVQIKRIRKQFKTAHLFLVENRGRDILPFLQIINTMELEKYKYVCKIHTKKSEHSSEGDLWRKLMYHNLLGCENNIKKHWELLDKADVSLSTFGAYIFDGQSYMYQNKKRLKELSEYFETPMSETFCFSAGSMFWAKGTFLKSIGNIDFNTLPVFEKEAKQIDGTLAHAFERLFGLICYDKGDRIGSISNEYETIPLELIEDVQSLSIRLNYQLTKLQKDWESGVHRISYLGSELDYAMKIVEQRDGELKEKEDERLVLGKELEYAMKIVEQRDSQLKERDSQLKERGEQLKERDSQLKERDEQLRDLDEVKNSLGYDLEYARNIVDERDAQIEENLKSIAYYHDLAHSLGIKNRIKRSVKKALPSKLFYTLKNLKPKLHKHNRQKVYWYLKRGKIKTLVNKTIQSLKEKETFEKESFTFSPKQYFKPKLSFPKLHNNRVPVDILIPVYNGYEYLEPLFTSILKNTSVPYRLVVINDASPDEKVKPLLLSLMKEHKNTVFLENEKNLGFVKSVNKAVEVCKTHFVLLNTDTEVPEAWMQRLMWPIFNRPHIATTTPFTNAGTIASFPEFLEDNSIFKGRGLKQVDKGFQYINSEEMLIEVPTGVGFCMGVNYDLYKEIGFFDEESFGKGYGEENDWCRRAVDAGYQNVMVPDLFVYHKHGGSFDSVEKKRLIAENYLKLLNKHPDYEKQVHTFIGQDPYSHLRDIVKVLILANEDDVILVFDHDLGGGANTYTKQKVQAHLQENKKILKVAYAYNTREYKVELSYEDENIQMRLKTLDELFELLNRCHFKEIFINELVSYEDIVSIQKWIIGYKNKYACLVTLPLHDYFALCPSFTLLDNVGKFCELPSYETCKKCLASNDSEIMMFSKERNIETWRENWSDLLDVTDKVLAFSNASRNLFSKAYPVYPVEQVQVIPHKVEMIEAIKNQTSRASTTVNIGVLGAINEAKGILVLEKLVKYIEEHGLDIKITVIGETNLSIESKHFEVTGRYEHSRLREIVLENEIDIFFIPSIWPETFSYTTQEVMMMDYPLMVFNLGAPAERVVDYSKGYIIDEMYPEAIVKTIQEVQVANT